MLTTKERPFLLPQPVKATWSEGCFNLSAATRIGFEAASQQAAALLASYLRPATRFSFPLYSITESDGKDDNSVILITRAEKPRSAPDGWYQLQVGPALVVLKAADAEGFNNAIQTFRQLLPPAIYDTHPRINVVWQAPCVEIQDWPHFKWRGVMLDSCRHYQPLEWIFKWIEWLAQHKINVFHWHLSDDQSWRLEIKKYPRLVEVGSRRNSTMMGHNWDSKPYPFDNIEHCGYYTQEECRQVVEFASQRGITIVPEIDLPGHATAIVAAYPEFGLSGKPADVATTWGVHTRLINLRDETLRFVDDVVEALLDIFPGTYIHLGGDEAVKDEWDADPWTQKRIRELGLKDTVELQAWFTRRMANLLRERGRRLIGWDEIMDGGIPKECTLLAWTGEHRAVEGVRRGHDVVLTPKKATYFDYYQGDPEAEPLAIGGLVRLEDIYDYSPMPDGLTRGEARHIIGIQAQMWSEYLISTSRVEYMAFPRLCALAEMAWRKKKKGSFAAFRKGLRLHMHRLNVQDIRYRGLD